MTSIEPVPNQLIGETAWTMLAEAANDVHHPMRIVTLATVDRAWNPQARSMILRGANQDAGRIWFHSDEDTRKVRELQAHPRAAVLAYHPCMSVQLRITGAMKLHKDDALAQDHWLQTNLSLRHAYGHPEAEGAGKDQRLPFQDPRLQRLWRHDDQASRAADQSRFIVLELHVETIEWLQSIGSRQWTGIIRAAEKWRPPRRSVQARSMR